MDWLRQGDQVWWFAVSFVFSRNTTLFVSAAS
jgi:hypothetical protein